MFKKAAAVFVLPFFVLCLSLSVGFAQSEGIPLQSDVYLGTPIYSAEDLPEQITFNIYDSQDALVPLGTQTFNRGQYTVDFQFSKSDGVSSGDVARVNAEFTQKLNLTDADGEAIQPKELWAGLAVNGTEIGSRTKVSDETMVQLLLASDASIATYVTLAYEGDDNPLTTIYKDLPLSSLTSDSANTTLSDYFSMVPTADSMVFAQASEHWVDAGTNDAYITGDVAIGGIGAPQYAKLRVLGGRVRIYSKQSDNLHLGFRNGDANSTNPMAWMGVDTSGNYTFGDRNGNGLVTFRQDGKVSIGTTTSTYKLSVNGSIGCRELTVTNTGWADFVFKDGYDLPTLEEVETFVIKNKHLPGIPTEDEVEKNGVSLGDMSTKLLQKVEELTLYMIEIKKENAVLKAQLAELEKQIRN